MNATINNQLNAIENKKQNASKKLYIGAWVIEIFAVIIGLGIALMTVYASMDSLYAMKGNALDAGDYVNIAIASIPFVMVAIVEITKIPFCEAIYFAKQLYWKVIFIICLFFISFITFESAFNGFERNFNALMHQVDVPKKELVTVDEKIEFLGSEFKKASELTQQKIDDAYNAQYKELSKQKNDQLSVLNDQMADLRARTESKYINSLRNNIKKNDAEINSLRAKRDSELEQVDKNYELLLKNSNNSIDIKRRNIQNQYQVGREDLKKMERDFREALDEANFFTSSTIEEKWTEKINAQKEAVENIRSELNRIDIGSANDQSYQKIVLDKQKIEKRFEKKINQLKTENRKLNIEVSKSISTKEKEIQGFIDDKRSEINGVEKNFNRQIKEISERRDNDYRILKNLAETKRVLNEDISVLGDRRVQLREEINKRVGDSQIYRMAQWWWDKENAADISRKNVATIATVWFGSLALLIALTGVALAFASLVLGTPREKDLLGKQKPFQKLTRAVRIYLAGRNRKREVKYIEKDKIVFKEVPKEVEVQKVVFTEVPVEVVKKEIVHIPFYTNDPTLLNMNSIDSDNDDEAVFKPNNKEV